MNKVQNEPDYDLNVTIADGKYTVRAWNGEGLHALRYGQWWRDLAGDGLVLALAQEVESLRAELENEQARGIHTCHENCQRPLCVARRRVRELEKEVEELMADKARLDHLQTQWYWYDGGDSGYGYWSTEVVGPDSTPRYHSPKPTDERPDIRYAIDVDRGIKSPNVP